VLDGRIVEVIWFKTLRMEASKKRIEQDCLVSCDETRLVGSKPSLEVG
jgi:hypothetical protein